MSARPASSRFITFVFSCLAGLISLQSARANAPELSALPLLKNGFVGSTFSWQIPATNTPTFYTASGLPSGLILDRSTGYITGTPRAAGAFIVTVAAANNDGTSFVPSGGGLRQTLLFSISGTPTSGSLPVIDDSTWGTYVELPLGQSFNQSIAATNTDATSRYVMSGTLPPGLALVDNVISGTATQSGLYPAEVAVTNLHGYALLRTAFFVPSNDGAGVLPVLTAPSPVTVDLQDRIEVFLSADAPVREFVSGPLPVGIYLDAERG